MKIPLLKKKFKSLDIAFLFFIWIFWAYLKDAYLSGELFIRTIEVSRDEQAALFWPLYFILATGFLFSVWGLLFKELPSRPTEYDHYGNNDREP